MLNCLTRQQLDGLVAARPGETKLGQRVTLISELDDNAELTEQGVRFVLVGIADDIGPRANCGQGGAHLGWQAFLKAFVNLQDNDFLSGNHIAIAGVISPPEVPSGANIDRLRQSCAELDQRVVDTLTPLFSAGLKPIIIGGGHNNAYGAIKACYQAFGQPLAVANFDPHSDFRALEGRHSGNPFRYAYDQGMLSHYSVLGLHEQKNSRDALAALSDCNFPWYSVQQICWRRELPLSQAIGHVVHYLLSSGQPVGLELDMDAISEMPSSAMTRAGMSLDDALYYVERLARQSAVKYLHLAEAAPERHPAGQEVGMRVTGQALAELVCGFVKANISE